MIEKGFHLFTGNRLEHLSRALAAVIRKPLSDPFLPECIVVQSSGMARFISLKIADHLGIAANMNYLFPNSFIYKTLGTFSKADERNLFNPEVLSWKICSVLPDLLTDPEFAVLSGYVNSENGSLKLYQLSCRIADTFDQYLLYRPDMIASWENGAERHWQALLWRKIASESDDVHRVRLFSSFMDVVKNEKITEGHFPERVSVFGISALPKYHMDVFQMISAYCQVNLFLMNPCGTYWGDILSERERAREKRRHVNSRVDDLYTGSGNSLLSSLGTVGRDFFDLVHSYSMIEYPVFEPPEENSLLTGIQADIFHLRNVRAGDIEKRIIEPDDHSIQIHTCHSPLREVEVLHDRIYRMFEDDPELSPRDILVMTPDIEIYAPLIHAVFGKKTENRDPVPYSVADRGYKQENRIAACFLSLLDLVNSRFTTVEVLGILDTEAVRLRFGIDESDLDIISRWISDTKIRWGRDANQRKNMDLPMFEENSWRSGLKRMLLGYAMPVDEKHLFSDILPYDPIEGNYADLLGRFLTFIRTLFEWVESLTGSWTISEWADRLDLGITGFFIDDDIHAGDMKDLRDEIRSMREDTGYAGYADKVDLQVIRHHLGKSLEKKEHGYGFITGGVTFCAMLPMRSIPFKRICLIGMNANSYPRQNHPAGFDLMARHPRPGDRSRRNDDRYLFLEALISARQSLYISYTGRNVRDNSLMQPSVLVSELLDHIEETWEVKGGNIRKRLILEHPLQPFSDLYFMKKEEDGPGLFSYSRDNFLAALRSRGALDAYREFIPNELGPPGEEFHEVDIRDFCSFFKHPQRYLLEKRIGLVLPGIAEGVEEDEPFDVGWLDRYGIENRLVDGFLNGESADTLFRLARATGSLPYGRTGEHAFNGLVKETRYIAERVRPFVDGVEKTSRDIVLFVNGLSITGTVEGIFGNRLIHYRPAGIKGKDLISAWINHLALCAMPDCGKNHISMVSGIEMKSRKRVWSEFEIHRPADPLGILEFLVECYFRGLRKALHFFPETSLAFFDAKDRESVMRMVRDRWEGNEHVRGEGFDDYNRLLFKGNDPFDDDFISLALGIYTPLHENLVEVTP